jgi:effector-binding domain-containing protein
MKRPMQVCFAAAIIIIGGMNVMAIEEAPYTVVKQDGRFEIRDYASHILAEIVVDGDLEQAGNKAFNNLFRYISGDNRSRKKVAMTAPVSQEPMTEKIQMTAPVGQQRVQDKWAISFMMPASYSLETLPEPIDPKIKLRQVPAHRMATVRYSGFWSEEAYLSNKKALEAWMHDGGLVSSGEPVWARYNPPFTLWFMRRNEILIPVKENFERDRPSG